jgi:predicted metal-dependent phosphoesterase TrpH
MHFDIHVHTTISACSKLYIHEILENARAIALDGVCITDHDTMEIKNYLQEGMQPNGLCVVFGMEYATETGDYLIFGPFENISPCLSDLRLLETVHQAGGVAVAAHPFRSGRSCREPIFRGKNCGALEVINGRNTELENLRAKRIAQKYHLTECGGSDAHTIEELGRVITCFNYRIRSREDLIFALKNNLCRAQLNDKSPSNWNLKSDDQSLA